MIVWHAEERAILAFPLAGKLFVCVTACGAFAHRRQSPWSKSPLDSMDISVSRIEREQIEFKTSCCLFDAQVQEGDCHLSIAFEHELRREVFQEFPKM